MKTGRKGEKAMGKQSILMVSVLSIEIRAIIGSELMLASSKYGIG